MLFSEANCSCCSNTPRDASISNPDLQKQHFSIISNFPPPPIENKLTHHEYSCVCQHKLLINESKITLYTVELEMSLF